MSAIATKMARYFKRGAHATSGNDRIAVNWNTNEIQYSYHNTVIARRLYDNSRLTLHFPEEHCTASTQSRLQALMTLYDLGTVTRRRGKWIINGVEV